MMLQTRPWAEGQEIVDRFASLNPYEPKAGKGSILNLVDANYIELIEKKDTQRQLYGYSIAPKRYALYETGKSDIRVVDPKAHGIGFLYPPEDSPKGWEERVPRWIFQPWECRFAHYRVIWMSIAAQVS